MPLLKPEKNSQTLLGITRSKAKMYEYSIPQAHHIELKSDPALLFRIAIAILGDVAAELCRTSWDAGPNQLLISDRRKTLIFAASFFDAYLASRLDQKVDEYLLLLASCAYYLCDLPGSASVLNKQLGPSLSIEDATGLDVFLVSILKDDFSQAAVFGDVYHAVLDPLSSAIVRYASEGVGGERIQELVNGLRSLVYRKGNSRELLLADAIGAVARRKFENSLWNCLPRYSGLNKELWSQFIQTGGIRELWPSQHILGQAGILQGASAVIQMPTSAGKTKATELIIRSAFLAKRTVVAFIVAPFRALCNEIRASLSYSFRNDAVFVEEFSDIFQLDFNLDDFGDAHFIVVLTPEKLLYSLRQAPALVEKPGLVIFDEGHQFDSEKRGIIYELLLTTLKLMLPSECQKILISAVISNGKAIGDWLNGPAGQVANGANLMPTLRSVGFAVWDSPLGLIRYPEGDYTNPYGFVVPRVIEQVKFGDSGRKRFPLKNTNSIAAYLGLKLVSNGSVAVFCGVKATANVVLRTLVEAFESGLTMTKPSALCSQTELTKLIFLLEENLGADAIATRAAALGVFAHHADVPHGLKLAIEFAMRESLIRLVVCTSTLAQGVNLPLRYVIVTSLYQGQDLMKVRDFHNLIGRAGRSGMYTEGTVIFADLRAISDIELKNKYHWNMHTKLLKGDLEPCVSSILRVFEPIRVTVKRGPRRVPLVSRLDFLEHYLQNVFDEPALLNQFLQHFQQMLIPGDTDPSQELSRELSERIRILHSIESFLMANWDVSAEEDFENDTIRLAEETLGYSLAGSDLKPRLPELFLNVARVIFAKVADSRKRAAYGRTLLGLVDSGEIDLWVNVNAEQLRTCSDDQDFVEILWPLFEAHLAEIDKCSDQAALEEAMLEWLGGASFYSIHQSLLVGRVRRAWGQHEFREYTLEQTVSLCEREFAFQGSHLLGGVIDLLALLSDGYIEGLRSRLRRLQKRLRYGLATDQVVAVYEMGFADRVVAADLALSLGLTSSTKEGIRKEILSNRDGGNRVLRKYPSFFSQALVDMR